MALLPCNRCGKSYPVRGLQLDLGGRGLICPQCANVISKVHTHADKIQQQRLQSAEDSLGKRKSMLAGGKQYLCNRCKYKFVSHTPNLQKCPYCSEEGRLVTEEDLVKEIDDILRTA